MSNVSKKNKSGLTKAERKAYWDNQEREKKKEFMFDYSEHDKSIGKFTKDFRNYYAYDHTTFEPLSIEEQNAIFDTFPEEFKKAGVDQCIIFDSLYWITLDTDDFTFTIPHTFEDGHTRYYRPYYSQCKNDEEKKLFDIHIAKGERSNPKIIIFHKDHPDIIFSQKINIWGDIYSDYYVFMMEIRPNRIYINDCDGVKIYDFELNLLYKKLDTEEHSYHFNVDKDNWNHLWIWNIKEAKEMKYENLESISELVVT